MKDTLIKIELINEDKKCGFGVKIGFPDFIDTDSKEVKEIVDDVEKIVHKLGELFGATSLDKQPNKEDSSEDVELTKMLKTAKMLGELAGMMKKVAPKHATEEQLEQLDEMEQFAEIAKFVEKLMK